MLIASHHCFLITPQTNQKKNSVIRCNPYSPLETHPTRFPTFLSLTNIRMLPSFFPWVFLSVFARHNQNAKLLKKIPARRQLIGMKTANSDKIFETSSVGLAPSKDFFSLIVMKDTIAWRTWKITLRSNKSLPSETIQSWQDFEGTSNGKRLQSEIRRVFGADTLNYVLSLVTQSWLPYLKSDITVEILVQLDLPDIARLAQVR